MPVAIQSASPDFDYELEPGSIREMQRLAGAGTGDVIKLKLANILVSEGFNLRTDKPEWRQHVSMLADSIEANGYDITQPLTCYVQKEGDISVALLVDGFSRVAAWEKLIAEKRSAPEVVPVMIVPKGSNEVDLTLRMLREGKEKDAWEKSIGVKRLLNAGVEPKEIARRIPMTLAYVELLLKLHELPEKAKKLIVAGKVSASAAMGVIRESGVATAGKELLAAMAAKTTATERRAPVEPETPADPDAPKRRGRPKKAAAPDAPPAEVRVTKRDLKRMQAQKDAEAGVSFEASFEGKVGEVLTLDEIRQWDNVLDGDWCDAGPNAGEVILMADVSFKLTGRRVFPEKVKAALVRSANKKKSRGLPDDTDGL